MRRYYESPSESVGVSLVEKLSEASVSQLRRAVMDMYPRPLQLIHERA